jgi:hypothetical protein
MESTEMKSKEVFSKLFPPNASLYCSRSYLRANMVNYISTFEFFELKKTKHLMKKEVAVLLTSNDEFERWIGELLLSEYKKGGKPLPSQKFSQEDFEFLIFNKVISDLNSHLFCLEHMGILKSFDLTCNEPLIVGLANLSESIIILTTHSVDGGRRTPVYYRRYDDHLGTWNASFSIMWPPTLLDDSNYSRNEYTGLICEKSLPLPSSKDTEAVRKKKSLSYKQKQFEEVDLKINDREDFNTKK